MCWVHGAIERFIGKEQHPGIAMTVFHSIFETHACGENRSDAAIFFGDVDSDYAAAVIGRQIRRRAAQAGTNIQNVRPA